MIITHGNSNLQIELATNQITFLDSRFYRTESGNYVPSVTTYLEAYPKSPQFFDWLKKQGENADEVRDEAGRRGSVVHNLTERYDSGEQVSLMDENGFIRYKLSEWAMFERYVDFREKHNSEVLLCELNLTSDTLQAGGTLDRVMTINGKTLIVDIKTSNMMHEHYWLQLAAYKYMLLEGVDIHVDGVAILWLNAKTRTEGKAGQIQGRGWQLIVCTDEKEQQQHLQQFKCCQQLWLAANGDQKPRQVSYQMSHQIKRAV